jgi:hypothetical protein
LFKQKKRKKQKVNPVPAGQMAFAPASSKSGGSSSSDPLSKFNFLKNTPEEAKIEIPGGKLRLYEIIIPKSSNSQFSELKSPDSEFLTKTDPPDIVFTISRKYSSLHIAHLPERMIISKQKDKRNSFKEHNQRHKNFHSHKDK